jgi:hypothetical protein
MENTIIWFAELLGAKTFKKYWPVGGSYWNRAKDCKKLDPADKYELQRIIKNAYEYTQAHVQALVFECILILPLCLFLTERKSETIYTCIALAGIHFYALLIHEYNRILARRRLETMKDEPDELEPDELEPYKLQVIDINNSGSWYRLGFKYARYTNPIYIGSYFASKERAEEFKDSLERKFQHIEDPAERAAELIMWNDSSK